MLELGLAIFDLAAVGIGAHVQDRNTATQLPLGPQLGSRGAERLVVALADCWKRMGGQVQLLFGFGLGHIDLFLCRDGCHDDDDDSSEMQRGDRGRVADVDGYVWTMVWSIQCVSGHVCKTDHQR
jgi:hypothetical protein